MFMMLHKYLELVRRINIFSRRNLGKYLKNNYYDVSRQQGCGIAFVMIVMKEYYFPSTNSVIKLTFALFNRNCAISQIHSVINNTFQRILEYIMRIISTHPLFVVEQQQENNYIITKFISACYGIILFTQIEIKGLCSRYCFLWAALQTGLHSLSSCMTWNCCCCQCSRF